MSVELPKFVSSSFLLDIFVKNFGSEKSLTVKSWRGEWATKKGDNYASDMYRIFVDLEIDGVHMTKSVLLKVGDKSNEAYQLK